MVLVFLNSVKNYNFIFERSISQQAYFHQILFFCRSDSLSEQFGLCEEQVSMYTRLTKCQS